ncbi:MAG: GldG family protein [bacterium]|nr:GldG family protein [bacterium]
MDFKDKKAYSLNNKVLAVVVAGVLILLNVFSYRFFVRSDWTATGRYSLSESSEKVLENLNDLVKIKAYFTGNPPPQFLRVRQYVSDLLMEYDAAGDEYFDYEFIDPEGNPEVEQEAGVVGVVPVTMQARDEGEAQSKTGYLGIGIFYQGKTDAIPVIDHQKLETFENDLTTAIFNLTQPNKKVVGFLTGHGEYTIGESFNQGSQADQYSFAAQVLRKNFEVRTVNLAEDEQPLEGVDVLVSARPESDFSQRDTVAIDQFLKNGGSLLLLVDGYAFAGGADLEPIETNALEFLRPLGVSVQRKLLLDSSADKANIDRGGIVVSELYEPFLRLLEEHFSDGPIMTNIRSLSFRFTSPLLIEPVEGLEYDEFIRTTDQAWVQEEPFKIQPNNIPPPTDDIRSQHTVAVAVSGVLPSLDAASSRSGAGESKPSRVIVVSDTEFLGNPNSMALQFGMVDFTPYVVFLNMVNYLAYGNDFINILGKTLDDSPIKTLTKNERRTISLLGIALVPVLVTMAGALRLWRRKRSDKISS